MTDFKEYFKFPLRQDEYAPFIVWTADNERAFDFCISDKEIMTKIMNVLSGDSEKRIQQIITHKDGILFIGDNKLLMIRSWGHLTGQGGGLGLSSERATEIQNEFCEWIIETLTKKS